MAEEIHADRIEGMAEPPPDQLGRCGELDVLEAAITLHQKLKIRLKGKSEEQVILPLDLTTHDGADHLLYKQAGNEHTVDVSQIEAIAEFKD